jgi:hypothetical protein
MKLLKADDNQGYFLIEGDEFSLIDQITKEDLLRLAELVLEEDEVEFDPYDDEVIKNEAHRILYGNILEKLEELRARREEFVEQRDGLYREAYEQYQQGLSVADGQGTAGPPAPRKPAPPPKRPPSPARKPFKSSQPEPPSDDDIPF